MRKSRYPFLENYGRQARIINVQKLFLYIIEMIFFILKILVLTIDSEILSNARSKVIKINMIIKICISYLDRILIFSDSY